MKVHGHRGLHRPSLRWAILLFILFLLVPIFATAAPSQKNEAVLTITSRPEVVFNSSKDACEPIDVPDINPRAFRDANGEAVLFALHFVNRALRGPDLDHVKLDCRVVLGSGFDIAGLYSAAALIRTPLIMLIATSSQRPGPMTGVTSAPLCITNIMPRRIIAAV